jgi:hypothetical protein
MASEADKQRPSSQEDNERATEQGGEQEWQEEQFDAPLDARKQFPKANYEVKKLYEAGAPLYTKEALLDLESQLAIVPQPDAYKIRSFDGSIVQSRQHILLAARDREM